MHTISRNSLGTLIVLAAIAAASRATAAAEGAAVPALEATSLEGKSVTRASLVGETTILIVTPTRGAAADTRQWANALREKVDLGKARVRDILAIDLPFFISDADALRMAREKIPERYYNQTWLLEKGQLKSALGVPLDSEDAYVFVLDAEGRTLARVTGSPTAGKIGRVQSALAAASAGQR